MLKAFVQRADALELFDSRWEEWVYRASAPRAEIQTADGIDQRLRHFDFEKTIVFVAKRVFFNQLRISAALRARGYKTVAIGLENFPFEQHVGFFDEVFSVNLPAFLQWWSSSKNVLVHAQNWLFRNHIPVLLDAFRPESSHLVVEMMDVQSFILPDETVKTSLPQMQAVWGEDCADNHSIQIKSEEYLLRKAGGVIFPGNSSYSNDLGVQDKERELNFCSYPLREFFASPTHPIPETYEDFRLVFAGGIPPFKDRIVPEFFSDAQLLSVIDGMMAQGLQLDIFNNPKIVPSDEYEQLYRPHLDRAEKHQKFRFMVGDLPWKITPKLASYDLGLMIYDFTGLRFGEKHFTHLIPTKFFLYLEAGLPILVSDRWKAVADVVRKHQIGRVVAPHELKDLPKALRGLDLEKLRTNVERARNEIAMDVEIERLIRFYRRIRASYATPGSLEYA